MDFNIVTLEIASHIIHFDYYDQIVSGIANQTTGASEEQIKIRNKSREHLSEFFSGDDFFDSKDQLRPLYELSSVITTKIKIMKSKDVHALIEKLEKDAKKMKKLYKALSKKEQDADVH